MTQAVAEPDFFLSALAGWPVRQVEGHVPAIGFVETWSEHVWYRTIVSVMQARANQYGTTLLIIAPTVAVDAEGLSTYYRAVGRHWLPDFQAIASIPAEPGEVAAT